MSYQRPHDPYMHSNASQYDDRYQQSGYQDYPDKGSNYGGSNAYGQNAATNAAATYSYAKPKKGVSKWIKIGIPLLILIIAGAVVGGILGSRAANDSSSSGGSSDRSTVGKGSKDSGVEDSTLSASQKAAQQGGNNQLFYRGTDVYGNPSFVTAQADTSAASTNGKQHNSTCQDTFSGGSLTNLRPHPRIIAPGYAWDCLGDQISNDAYLTVWNETIVNNATKWLSASITNYSVDGGPTGSGILDVSREIQMKVKAWAYAYRVTGNNDFKTRLFRELNAAAGNSQESGWSDFSRYQWNPDHFLDTAEMTAAFAIAYDWLHDAWSEDERNTLVSAIVNYGLVPGQNQYQSAGWWRLPENGNGNWNCVCNGGLLTGALAIRGDGNDTETGIADSIINSAVQNMRDNCMRGVYSDGTWSETPNYWYFGTNAQARAVSALISATGSDQGMMAANPNWYKTNDFHMYVSGNAGMFFYGDNGPGKFATTANQLMLYSKLSGNPAGALFQRDRADAAFDPLSMFWYDPATVGAYWNGLALDKFFDNEDGGQWASMRSSWTDYSNGVYVGVKASNGTGHQTHGDLDAGTFVIDALGTRWAGELGNGNYLSQDYFSNETANSARWTYYRKATQGQNTLVINNQNQVPNCAPSNRFQSTGAAQTGDLNYKPAATDAAYFISDLSSCYSLGNNAVQRGIRMLNGRRQVLVRDEIAQQGSINNVKWRVQTNGTVSLSPDGRTATLKISKIADVNAGVTGELSIGGTQTMVVKILQPANARFTTDGPPATRIYGQPVASPPPQESDQENTGVTALQIELDGGSAQTIEVVWQPQYSELTAADQADPKSVSLSQWSLTSHNA